MSRYLIPKNMIPGNVISNLGINTPLAKIG